MKKILFILMPHDFQDYEFIEPYTALCDAGHEVDVAGFTLEEAVGHLGKVSHTPNKLIDALTEDECMRYDALVIPGGPASTTYLWHNEMIQDIVRHFHVRDALVATICYACIVPVQAGILEGKEATVYPTQEAKAIFNEHNVTFIDRGCVVLHDSHIITAQGPKYAIDFAQEIIKELE